MVLAQRGDVGRRWRGIGTRPRREKPRREKPRREKPLTFSFSMEFEETLFYSLVFKITIVAYPHPLPALREFAFPPAKLYR